MVVCWGLRWVVDQVVLRSTGCQTHIGARWNKIYSFSSLDTALAHELFMKTYRDRYTCNYIDVVATCGICFMY